MKQFTPMAVIRLSSNENLKALMDLLEIPGELNWENAEKQDIMDFVAAQKADASRKIHSALREIHFFGNHPFAKDTASSKACCVRSPLFIRRNHWKNNSVMRIFAFKPDEHAGRTFAEILKAVESAGGPAIISLQPGRYLFRKEEAAFCDQPVSNTVVYDGNVPRKHMGLLLDGISDLTIEGNGAELLFDGDMSGIALLNCRNIILRDFSIDWLHPRVVEMRCTGCRSREADFELHPDSRAMLRDGKLIFLNPDGQPEAAEKWIVQCASADGQSNQRSPFHPYAEAAECVELAPGKFRFRYHEPHDIETGSIWQFRNPAQNENGIFLHECQNVELDHLKLYFTPGLGVIAQLCRDLNIHAHAHAPRPGSGRACAAPTASRSPAAAGRCGSRIPNFPALRMIPSIFTEPIWAFNAWTDRNFCLNSDIRKPGGAAVRARG